LGHSFDLMKDPIRRRFKRLVKGTLSLRMEGHDVLPIRMKRIGGSLAAAQLFFLILTASGVVGGASLPPQVSALQTSTQSTDRSSGSLYLVEVGPFPDRDRAAAIAKELSARGFSQAKVVDQTKFRVVSEQLSRSVATGRVATLAERGFQSQMEPSSGDVVQIIFGTFSTQQEAEALAHRIGAAGYDALVRAGTGYTVQVGSYPLSSVVDTIVTVTNIIKSRAPEATVTTGPVSAQASAPSLAPQAPQAPAVSAPVPPQTPPASPGPSPSLNDPLHKVEIGPFSDRDRAAAIARELSARGFSLARVVNPTRFRVVSEPLPRSVAEELVARLAGRGFSSQIERLGGDTVELVFGTFSTQQEAEALAHRVGAAGYDAWVRGGTGYTLEVGPYPQSAINTITGIVKSRAPEATVTTDSVSAPGPAPAPAPQVSPPPPVAAPQTPTISTPPPTPQGPQGSAATSSSPATSGPSQPAPQAPLPGASSGRAQAASWGLAQGAVVVPSRLVSPGSTVEADPFLIVPAQRLGPVRLGMPIRDETARLGASRGSADLGDGTMMYRWFEPPSNSGIGVRTGQNGMVLRAWVLNDERYRTKEGLHIGSTEAEVRAALGNPTAIDINVQGKTRTLIYESLGLWFGIQLDRQFRFYNAVYDIGIMAKK
jgi:hypothetical protein